MRLNALCRRCASYTYLDRDQRLPAESTTVRDIVLDMIGFDLNLVTKEELHREKVSRLVSPICFTPEDPPEPEIIEEVSQVGR